MRYILEGNEQDVSNVLQENRIRVERGVIKFTPYPETEEVVADNKDVEVEDSKDIDVASADDKKAPKGATKKK